MSNDNNLKGSGSARQNNIKHRDRAHPWHLPYLNTCIIKNCRTKPYYDGFTYFTCCLSCLREKELGPFYKNKNPRLINAEAQTPKLPRVSTTDVNPIINDDGVTSSNSDDLF